MRLLSLALRGLWWRRATSVSLLVVATFTTVVAAAGPLYASAAGDAVLQRALRTAPVGSNGTGIEVAAGQVGTPSTEALGRAVRAAFTGRAGEAYPTAVLQLAVTVRGQVEGADGPGQVTLTDRDGFCAEVTVVAGRCVDASDPTGFVVDAATARALDLHVGQQVTLPGTRTASAATDTVLRLRGTVERRDPAGGYWFGAAAAVPGGDDPVPVAVPQAYFDGLVAEAGDNVVATADLTLDPGAVHTADVDAVQAAVDTATTKVKTAAGEPSASTGVREVVQAGLSGRSRLTVPIAVVVVELLALGWYLLNTLIGSAAEARGAEVALGKLRGLTPRATLVFTLLEPSLLLLAAIPAGVLGALLTVHGLAPAVIGADAWIRLGALPWLTAVAAAVGGLVAAVAGSLAVLRRPVLAQWRRTTRRPGRRAVVLEVVAVVLAVAGIVQLRLSGSLDGGRGDDLAVLAPGLLMVAGAVVASRAVAGLARLAFRATRASGAVATFVSVRQLARRPAGRRTFGVLTVAVALVVFGVSSAVVLAQNRHDRALVDVGAPVVVHITPDPRTDARVAAVDGGRHTLAAVFQGSTAVSTTTGVFDGPATASSSPTLLVVDPATFGSVGYWRTDFGSASLDRLLRPLTAAPPTTPTFTGGRLTLDASATTVPADVLLAADLTDAAGRPVTARFGALGNGDRSYAAEVPACSGGCRLRQLYVTRPSDRIGPLVMAFTVRALRVPGATGAVPVELGRSSWSALNPTPGLQTDPAETVAADSDGVHVAVAVSGRPGDDVPGFGAAAGVVTTQPALVAAGTVVGGGDSTRAFVNSPAGGQFAVLPAGGVTLLPRAGDAGVVLARDWVEAASASGYDALAPNQVWLSAAAPGDTVDRLRRAGVVVTGVERASDRADGLALQGPAFATALSVAGGVVAVALAAAAAVLTLALLARRRIFELAAMRALGVRTARLIASVVIEQAALVVGAAVSGLFLGTAAIALALPALPAYVDRPAYPAFVVDQPVGRLLFVVAGVALVLVLAVTVSAAALARAASPARLREAEG